MVGIGLVGCQASEEGAVDSAFVLHFRLPTDLTSKLQRYDRFLSRVDYLLIQLKSTEGYEAEFTYPPEKWDKIALPAMDFPLSETDRLEVKVQVWDRKRGGEPRMYPALRGKKKIAASEMSLTEVNTFLIRLTLDVSVHEYD